MAWMPVLVLHWYHGRSASLAVINLANLQLIIFSYISVIFSTQAEESNLLWLARPNSQQ